MNNEPITLAISRELLGDQPIDFVGYINDVLSGRRLTPLPEPQPVATLPVERRPVMLTLDEATYLAGCDRCACGHLDVLHNRDDYGDSCPLCDCFELRTRSTHQPPR